MNKLSYKIEEVELDDGYEKIKREVFYYIVDGKKLEFRGYHPVTHWEIIETDLIDDHFENKEFVIVGCCTCGYWECDCVVAVVTEKESSVQWQIHRRWFDQIIATYEFDKEEYKLVMSQMQMAAQKKIEEGKS